MATYHEEFEVAPDNTTLTTGNTVAASFAGTAIVSDDAQAVVGTYSALVSTSTSTTSQMRFDQTEVDESFIRFYLRLDALPAANMGIALFALTAGTTIGDCRVTPTGTLQLRDQTLTLVDTTTTALVADTWNRVEIHITNSRIEGRLFKDPNYHSSTPTEDETAWGGAVSNTGHGRTTYGINTASINTLWMDDVAYDSATWVGSAASAASPRKLMVVTAPQRW